MKARFIIYAFLPFGYAASYANMPGQDSVIMLADNLEIENQKIKQTVQYKFPYSSKVSLQISAYQVRDNDSICLYKSSLSGVTLKAGFHVLSLNLSEGTQTYFNPSFIALVKKFKRFPAGQYRTYISVSVPDSNFSFQQITLVQKDSTLAINSPLRNKMNSAFGGSNPSKAIASKNKSLKEPAANELSKASNKIDKTLGRKLGIKSRPEMHQGKSYVALYYEDWFIGRYEVKAASALKEKIAKESAVLKDNPSALVTNNLEDLTGISSQLKELNKKDKKDKESTGTIDIAATGSTGQEPGSQQDNNYLEFRGDFNTEVWDIPVQVEGYYTTQDKRRQAKASYFRLHYDATEAKSKLAKIVGAYKTKYEETVSKGKGLDGVYKSYLAKLSSEKGGLIKELGSSYDLNTNSLINTDELLNTASTQLLDSAKNRAASNSTAGDNAEKLARAKAKTDSIRQAAQKKYERLQEIEKKITKYNALLNQYRDQLSLDSGLTYSKLEKLAGMEDVSCKDLAKAAAGLLPEGKAKKFVYGLTHLDLGIINKYESDFTNAGQTLKGGSLGYDFGFAKTSVSAGKTEYVSRDGSMDRYNSYLVRVDAKPFLKQKIGLIYYTYSPSRQILTDNNFIKQDISIGSFNQPVHIISLVHDGSMGKNFTIQTEAATSYKKTGQTKFTGKDQSAIKTSLQYLIPGTEAEIAGEWEHQGKDFENNALPYIKAATQRYTLAAKSRFFKSFLSVGIQYNLLQQETFSSKGQSTKWGFDIKTHSKRYPNLSLSYKPFSTFRSYSDTLAIPQRPMAGEVWVAKATYQIKRKTVSHRFMLIYNRNSTNSSDTQNYRSTTVQAGYIYADKLNMVSTTIGRMQLPQLGSDGFASISSYFINATVSRKISKQLQVMLGQDVATGKSGLQRAATSAGFGYGFEKIPVSVRLQARYSNVQSSPVERQRINIWGGEIGGNWQFKTKGLSKKERNDS